MIISVLAGLLLIVILTAFFHRTLHMDMGGAIFTALIAAVLLAALVAGAISIGQLFG
jgi:hypothetical protein